MALFSREFIAVPEDRKKQLVFKWPDVSIRRFTRAIVNADEIALFVDTGRVVQTMGPGRHRIDASELPGIGALIDALSGGNAYRAELYFVATREFPGIKFGGRLDDIVDPRSEQIVTLRVFGEYSVVVRDPIEFISTVGGTVDLADPTSVQSWCADQLLKFMKVAVTRGIARGEWPVLGLSAFMPEIEKAVLAVVNIQLYEYGLRIIRLGNFDINLAPDDADRLKRLAKDLRYIELAGGFQQYAAGEMALGAGHGMAIGAGGAANQGGFLAAGLGLGAMQQHLAAQAQQAQAQPGAAALPAATPTTPPPADDAAQADRALPAAADKICAACDVSNPAGAKYCMGCGAALKVTARHCTNCGSELSPGARFCGECSAPVAAP